MIRDAAQIFWEQASSRLAARINFALWLERFAPQAFTLGCAGAIGLYALRRTTGPVNWIWLGLIATWIASAGWTWWSCRARRYQLTDARVLLESTLRLDARLSAAASAVTPWPARVALPKIVEWRSLAAPGWLLATVALLAIGAFAPLSNPANPVRPPVEKPPALAQTEAMLEALTQTEIVNPDSLAQLATEVRELSARSPAEQYTHSALEAADTLREQTLAAVSALANHYDTAANALAPFEGQSAAPGDDRLKGAADQLTAALNGLRSGRLAGNPDLADLINTAKKSLGQLSPEQIKQLRDRLKSSAGQAKGVAGAAGPGARIAQPTDSPWGPGWDRGEGYGRGGVVRGRGDAPLTMNDDPSAKNDGKIENVSNIDFARAQLGDLAGIDTGGAPEIDKTKTISPGAAGGVAPPAHGGDAVWVDRLTPSDRAALKDIFK